VHPIALEAFCPRLSGKLLVVSSVVRAMEIEPGRIDVFHL
jgi:hypothetical protein